MGYGFAASHAFLVSRRLTHWQKGKLDNKFTRLLCFYLVKLTYQCCKHVVFPASARNIDRSYANFRLEPKNFRVGRRLSLLTTAETST